MTAFEEAVLEALSHIRQAVMAGAWGIGFLAGMFLWRLIVLAKNQSRFWCLLLALVPASAAAQETGDKRVIQWRMELHCNGGVVTDAHYFFDFESYNGTTWISGQVTHYHMQRTFFDDEWQPWIVNGNSGFDLADMYDVACEFREYYTRDGVTEEEEGEWLVIEPLLGAVCDGEESSWNALADYLLFSAVPDLDCGLGVAQDVDFTPYLEGVPELLLGCQECEPRVEEEFECDCELDIAELKADIVEIVEGWAGVPLERVWPQIDTFSAVISVPFVNPRTMLAFHDPISFTITDNFAGLGTEPGTAGYYLNNARLAVRGLLSIAIGIIVSFKALRAFNWGG